jgi:hypothetical protein
MPEIALHARLRTGAEPEHDRLATHLPDELANTLREHPANATWPATVGTSPETADDYPGDDDGIRFRCSLAEPFGDHLG